MMCVPSYIKLRTCSIIIQHLWLFLHFLPLLVYFAQGMRCVVHLPSLSLLPLITTYHKAEHRDIGTRQNAEVAAMSQFSTLPIIDNASMALPR